MKKYFIILLLLFFAMSKLFSLNITLKKVAIIDNEKITLNDLTESYEGDRHEYLKIQQVIIAELPYESRMINIQSRLVLQKIKLFNPDVNIRINSIVTAVRWESLKLCSDIIRESATKYLTEFYSLSQKAKVNIVRTPEISVPSVDVELRFTPVTSTENINYKRLNVEVIYEDKIINVSNLIATVEDFVDVLQAKKNIRRGDIIGKDDFVLVSILANQNHKYVTDLGNDTEWMANSVIRKGSYLQQNNVVSTPFVVRNDLVTVLIRTVSMQMSYQALAKNNGWIGDKIMLQNPDSKQIFYAEVIDKNKVLINLED